LVPRARRRKTRPIPLDIGLPSRGFTTLHAAAFADQLTLLGELLPDAKAPAALLEKETPMGETAVEIALRYRRDRAADLLLRHGASLRRSAALPPLHDAARMDSVARVATLLTAGAECDALFQGKSALALAREHGSRRVESLLLPRATAP
jgi:ankyrin repeat protein